VTWDDSFGMDAFGADGPELVGLTPEEGTAMDALDPFEFTVQSLGLALFHVQITARLGEYDELVYDGGFEPEYSAGSAVDTTDPSQWVFSIVRDPGWPLADLDLHVVAVDETGAKLEVSTTFSVSNPTAPADTSPPVVSNVTPSTGTAIARTASVALTVTDDVGFRRIVLVAKFSTGWEVVYDGTGFSPGYIGRSSVQVLVVGTSYRFTIFRTAGWPESPTIVPYAFDSSGNEPV
jgi:hypothetical protein